MKGRVKNISLFFLLSCFVSVLSYAQPTWTINPFGKEKKPAQYEEKILGSEKTADKKFTLFRRVLQNNITHYNYYYNANNKLNGVIERAKIAHKDDYSKLLSFYPYTLDYTATQKVELDSVIYKSTAGILIHDLRTDWVDNLYLLIGKAYYYRKLYDSASLTFQFINYNLFPRKKNEDDNRTVGANNNAQSSVLSIADKEKRNLIQKAMTLPPSRNDALIWLTRTFIEQEQFGDAAGMINILQTDPNLPKRLKNDLNEVISYWFFKQKNYDSAAIYLENGMSAAENKNDKSRWQFLLAQLNEIAGNYDKAADYYSIAGKRTADPLMDIFAHLNSAKMLRDNGNRKELDNSIAVLKKMSKKDKYQSYRDIINYSVGQLSLKKSDTLNGIAFFEKSLKYNETNVGYKNKSHLELGKIFYSLKNYREAANHYDSLNVATLSSEDDSAAIVELKSALRQVANQLDIIDKEDSLQRIASMPLSEVELYVKKLLKKLRKDQGVKQEEDFGNGDAGIGAFAKVNEPADLFGSSTAGEWYFYNAVLKTKGFDDFRVKWGKRENKDNWRRKSSIDLSAVNTSPFATGDPMDPIGNSIVKEEKGNGLSYDKLMSDLPLTPEKKDSSNSRIANALILLAQLFENDLQDYPQAILAYNNYLLRFPDRLSSGMVYMGLYHCYTKLGDNAQSLYYKNLLETTFPDSKPAELLSGKKASNEAVKNLAIAAKYEAIYDLFIEGNFMRAVSEKNIADSLYGKTYWTPQLLYIEAINYIKCQEDSEAIVVLNNIIQLYPASPLKNKAVTLISVLKRRPAIEKYLNDLQITRQPEDDKIIMADDKLAVKIKPPLVQGMLKVDSLKSVIIKRDSIIQLPPSMISGVYNWQPDKLHYVMMILDKVDPIYVNEARNAFNRFNQSINVSSIVINKDILDPQKSLLMFSSFENAASAMIYLGKLKKSAPEEVSWLTPSKYSFMIISDDNFKSLKINKDLDVYKKLLNNQYPGQF